MGNSISAVIVTFNRQNDFLRCIDAVFMQSINLDNVIIVNNASTDNTLKILNEKFSFSQYTEKLPIETDDVVYEASVSKFNESVIYLLNLQKNTGGAGGFYTGLKFAHQNLKTDYYWLMDDDGYPSDNCLEMLVSKSLSDKLDYVMPVSLDINHHEKLSWFVHKPNKEKTDAYQELRDSWGPIMDFVVPFNGVLLTKNIVENVGYINKDFFIWGDDYEHFFRCKKAGFIPVTYLDAKFYHLSQTVSSCKMCFGLFRISYTESKLRFYCMIRNWTYIYLRYNQKIKVPIKYLMYLWFFMFTRHFDIAGWKLYKKAVKAGKTNDFTGHFEYLIKKS